MGHSEGVSREQKLLFPDVVDDYIDEGNPVRFIDAFVDGLDLEELGFERSESASTGRPPYHPSDILKLYIYGYLNCVRSNGYLSGMRERVQAALKISFKLSRLNGQRIQGEARHTSKPSADIKGSLSEEEKSRQRKRASAKACQGKEEESKSLVSD